MALEGQREQFDPGAVQVAGVYARALLGAAEKAGQSEDMLEELDRLVEDVLDPYPEFEAVLVSDVIAGDEKLGILDRTLKGRISDLLMNFLKVTARHGRLRLLRAIRRAAHQLYDELRGRVPVEVATAAPLEEGLAGRLAERLREMTEGEPQLLCTVRPELIAGVVLRIGDTVYDGSVAARLNQIRAQMIQRSVHEIQSRRDRFRSASGD